MAYDYLADLNPEQRRAVKHGVRDGSATDSKPLLVIAGAGTGKTKTLAHRVAHLIVNGVDPAPHLVADLLATSRCRDDRSGETDRRRGARCRTY
jgi:hypothetical protein